jgi:hypothetical protein
MMAPNAALRDAVTASAAPAGATLQLLEQARATTDWREMGQTAGQGGGWE